MRNKLASFKQLSKKANLRGSKSNVMDKDVEESVVWAEDSLMNFSEPFQILNNDEAKRSKKKNFLEPKEWVNDDTDITTSETDYESSPAWTKSSIDNLSKVTDAEDNTSHTDDRCRSSCSVSDNPSKASSATEESQVRSKNKNVKEIGSKDDPSVLKSNRSSRRVSSSSREKSKSRSHSRNENFKSNSRVKPSFSESAKSKDHSSRKSRSNHSDISKRSTSNRRTQSRSESKRRQEPDMDIARHDKKGDYKRPHHSSARSLRISSKKSLSKTHHSCPTNITESSRRRPASSVRSIDCKNDVCRHTKSNSRCNGLSKSRRQSVNPTENVRPKRQSSYKPNNRKSAENDCKEGKERSKSVPPKRGIFHMTDTLENRSISSHQYVAPKSKSFIGSRRSQFVNHHKKANSAPTGLNSHNDPHDEHNYIIDSPQIVANKDSRKSRSLFCDSAVYEHLHALKRNGQDTFSIDKFLSHLKSMENDNEVNHNDSDSKHERKHRTAAESNNDSGHFLLPEEWIFETPISSDNRVQHMTSRAVRGVAVQPKECKTPGRAGKFESIIRASSNSRESYTSRTCFRRHRTSMELLKNLQEKANLPNISCESKKEQVQRTGATCELLHMLGNPDL